MRKLREALTVERYQWAPANSLHAATSSVARWALDPANILVVCGSFAADRPGETPLARTLSEAPRDPAATPGARRLSSEPVAGQPVTRRGQRAPGFGYQPALDGIRAFAVAAVLLYHAGQSWAVGGYLGVDAFFVLSGFLITTLLITEWSGRRRINLREFWIRRARRLLPALFVVMVGILAYTAWFAPAGEIDTIRGDALSALGYVANWRFVFSGQSYFAQFSQPSPLKHMWSLAIEEQFYLVWPLIVCFLLWWRKSLRALLVACVVMIAASALLMAALYHPGHDPSRVYYGTDTRAQSLLIGAVVGILLFMHGPIRSLVGRYALRAAAAVGVCYTLWLWWRMSERTDALYRGGFVLAALAVSAVIVCVVQPQRSVLKSALSLAPLRWIGRISYGLYLWHWPIYLWLTESRTGLDGSALLALRLAVSVGFAAASFVLVERPIRRGTFRLPRPSILVPAATLALVTAIVAVTANPGESVATQTVRALARSNAAIPKVAPTVPAAASGATGEAAPIAAAPSKVLLVGDSVAGSLGLGFDQAGPANSLAVWNRGILGCGLLSKGSILEGGELLPVDPGCDWRGRWVPDVDRFRPDVAVMLIGAWDVPDREVDGEMLRFGTVAYDTYFLHELDAATSALAADGARVVVLTSPFFSRPELVGSGRDWPEYAPWRVDRINSLFRDFLVAHPGRYTILDLNRFVSPQGRFTDTVDGVVVRGDGVHFTHAGSEIVAKWLAPQLREIAEGTDPEPAANTVQYDHRHLWAK